MQSIAAAPLLGEMRGPRVCLIMILAAMVPLDAAAPPSGRQSLIRATASASHSKVAITPELNPVSDEKFMKKDYPDDRRPKPYHDFGYPYPTVQDSEDYDHDYVEDKNDDGGYWAAQMRYDELKNRLMQKKDGIKRALSKLEEEKRELEKAIAAEKKAEEKAELAEAAEKEADHHHDKAETDLTDAKTDVNSGAGHVEAEVNDLEECKKQLQKARKELKALLEEKARAAKAKEKRDAAEEAAEKAEKAAQEKEAEMEKSLDQEQAEYDEALKIYEKEAKDVEDARKELDAAAKNLQKYRRADPDGGVYEVKKPGGFQGAAKRAAWPARAVVAVAAALLLAAPILA